jgi:signal transduction histidine kinase
MNLVVNGIQAMASLTDRSRELVIRSRQYDVHTVLVAVQDVGVGTDTEDLSQLFSAFYSTKSHGMGMGLAISRSMIEAHHGRIWAVRNSRPGLTFQFTIPTHQLG